MSCKLAHKHFSRTSYLPKRLTNLQVKRRIARDAVAEAGRFLEGKIAVVVDRDESGAIKSAAWCRAEHLAEALKEQSVASGISSKCDFWVWSD